MNQRTGQSLNEKKGEKEKREKRAEERRHKDDITIEQGSRDRETSDGSETSETTDSDFDHREEEDLEGEELRGMEVKLGAEGGVEIEEEEEEEGGGEERDERDDQEGEKELVRGCKPQKSGKKPIQVGM